MDAVRFGRVLGIGTRLAAKTLASAVDAATAPNPASGKVPGGGGPGERPGEAAASAGQRAERRTGQDVGREAGEDVVRNAGRGAGQDAGQRVKQVAQQVQQKSQQVKQAGAGLKRGSRRFGEAVWGPFVKLSGVLWLEVTGVFFGLFALTAVMAVWKQRGDLHETAANHDAHLRLLAACAMALVFGYFVVSSFVKASRRGKGK